MNSKDQLFNTNPYFSTNNILTFGYEITLENILFDSKSINRQISSIFHDWFTTLGSLHKYETCWSVTDYLNIQTFQTQKYCRFGIRASTTRFGTLQKICYSKTQLQKG